MASQCHGEGILPIFVGRGAPGGVVSPRQRKMHGATIIGGTTIAWSNQGKFLVLIVARCESKSAA
jgi:hypothetical protein